MITSTDFNPERVQRLIKNNKILQKAYLKQTKVKKGGPEVLKDQEPARRGAAQ